MGDSRVEKREEPSDLELLQASGRGDHDAFHGLIDRHGADLLRLARSLSRTRSDAEDVVQETLVGAFRGLKKFDGRSSVRTWLCRILMRQAARAWNRGKGQRATASLDASDFDRADTLVDARKLRASSVVADIDRRIDLHQVIDTLGEDHRNVIMLREIEGFSYAEIAELLNVPQGTIESRIHRARAELRLKLEPYFKQ